jgi:hypothetical protein
MKHGSANYKRTLKVNPEFRNVFSERHRSEPIILRDSWSFDAASPD